MNRRLSACGGLRRGGRGGSVSLVPIVASVSPAFGPKAGGTALTLTGARFTGATAANVGGAAGSVTVVSDVSLTCTSHSHAAGAVAASVTTPLGTGSGGTFTYQADTLTLTARTPASASAWCYSSAYSTSLGRWVYVGDDGSGNAYIATSDDQGVTMTTRTAPSGTGKYCSAVCRNAADTLFVAVGSSGYVATSADGITWTLRTAASSNPWIGVTWAGGAINAFVAVASFGTDRVMKSADGITWTAVVSAVADAKQWWSVNWSESLGRLVAVANFTAAANNVMWSDDATTWTAGTCAQSAKWSHAKWAPELSKWLMVGEGFFATSTDGKTWTAAAMDAGMSGSYGLCWNAVKLCFVAGGYGASYNFAVSVDGTTFVYSDQNGAPASSDFEALGANPTTGTVIAYDSHTYTNDSVSYTGVLT